MEKLILFSSTQAQASRNWIPLDLWFQILCFLPVKTLLVFRAVCKSFLSMIDDPSFVSSHLQRFPGNAVGNRFLTYLGRDSDQVDFEVNEINDIFSSKPRKPRKVRYNYIDRVRKPGLPSMNPRVGWSNLECSLNGLVLLSTTRRSHTAAALWNPSIKKHRQLSLPSLEVQYLGLGFDPSSNDHKVVSLHASRDQAWVYSVKTNSWTVISDRRFRGGKSYGYSYSKSLSFKNGVVWIESAYDRHGIITNPSRLVLFDFETERFRYRADDPCPYQQLMMLDDGSTIGVWWVDASNRVLIWALETDNETISWTLRYKLAPPHGMDDHLNYAISSVLRGIEIDRSILVEKNGELVWKYWVADGKTFKVVTFNVDVETQVYHRKDLGTVTKCLDIYIESFVMNS